MAVLEYDISITLLTFRNPILYSGFYINDKRLEFRPMELRYQFTVTWNFEN